jgi:endonuclease G
MITNRLLIAIKKCCAFTLFALFFIQNLAYSQIDFPSNQGEVIHHKYYSLSYIEEAEQPEWVAYKLTRTMLKKVVNRKDEFHDDWHIESGSASYTDYENYDAGHLCPARQMQFDCTAMHETFFMSNMSPQVPEFNRRAWAFLEKLERNMVWKRGELWIYVGPVLSDIDTTIGENKVAVPKKFYRILYDPTKDESLAFLMPNERILAPLESFVVSIDSIESITNIDFFSSFDEQHQTRLEGSKTSTGWSLENPNLTYGYTAKARDCSTAEILNQQAKISINQASKAALMQLPNIGPEKAQAIMLRRPFKSTYELLKVKGIGPATFEKLKSYIVL